MVKICSFLQVVGEANQLNPVCNQQSQIAHKYGILLTSQEVTIAVGTRRHIFPSSISTTKYDSLTRSTAAEDTAGTPTNIIPLARLGRRSCFVRDKRQSKLCSFLLLRSGRWRRSINESFYRGTKEREVAWVWYWQGGRVSQNLENLTDVICASSRMGIV